MDGGLAVPWQPNQPHRADVQKMVVHPAARRRGVARALLAALEQTARDLGRPALMLDCTPGWPAHALYLSAGWTEVGRVEDFARDENGVGTPTVFMQRDLS